MSASLPSGRNGARPQRVPMDDTSAIPWPVADGTDNPSDRDTMVCVARWRARCIVTVAQARLPSSRNTEILTIEHCIRPGRAAPAEIHGRTWTCWDLAEDLRRIADHVAPRVAHGNRLDHVFAGRWVRTLVFPSTGDVTVTVYLTLHARGGAGRASPLQRYLVGLRHRLAEAGLGGPGLVEQPACGGPSR